MVFVSLEWDIDIENLVFVEYYPIQHKLISPNIYKATLIKKHYITACNIRHIIHEPGHERMCLMSYANNKGADQPTHPYSAFVIHCLDSIISLDSIAEISRL